MNGTDLLPIRYENFVILVLRKNKVLGHVPATIN